jgi:hypothetical protein
LVSYVLDSVQCDAGSRRGNVVHNNFCTIHVTTVVIQESTYFFTGLRKLVGWDVPVEMLVDDYVGASTSQEPRNLVCFRP